MREGKIEYLQMLQEPIGRMSTISAVFKGFTATIVAGVVTVARSNMNILMILVSFLLILAFAILDIYYLKLERKFRYIFNQVRLDKHDIDFSMQITLNSDEIVLAKAGVWECIKSPSIYLFYLIMIIVLILVVVFNLVGIK